MRGLKLVVSIAVLGLANRAWAQQPGYDPSGAVPSGGMMYSGMPTQNGMPADCAVPMGPGMEMGGAVIAGETAIDPALYAPIPANWRKTAFNIMPKLTFEAGVLFWQPNFSRSPTIASQVRPNGTGGLVRSDVQVNAQSEYSASLKYGLTYRVDEFRSWEFKGWAMDGPSNRGQDMGPTDFYYDLNLNGYPFPTIADEAKINWDFQSFSNEINVLRHTTPMKGPIDEWSWGWGIRSVNVTEKMQARFTDIITNEVGVMTANVKNNLIGVQMIGRGRIQTALKRFRISAEGKIGFNYNPITTRTRVQSGVVGGLALTDFGNEFSDTYSVFSPSFEGNFIFEYFLTHNLNVYGGFHLYYANRVMRASEQFDPSVNVFLSQQKDYGSLFMFGPSCGLNFVY